MKTKLMVRMVMLAAVLGLIFTVACTKPQVKSSSSDLDSIDINLPDETGRTTADEAGQTEEQLEEAAIMAERNRAQEIFANEDIHFNFDQSSLSTTARNILSRKATWLTNNPDISVIIEGHCDERGTVEYNLALGDRRAKSTMDFLVDTGIESSRLSTVSYGEETPLNPANNEAAWAQNRRAHVAVR